MYMLGAAPLRASRAHPTGIFLPNNLTVQFGANYGFLFTGSKIFLIYFMFFSMSS